ncbi:MAG: CarD family transcriptional regulator [Oscillospiraceae bacterium]
MKWIKMHMRKELNGMFTEGQLVIYGGEGVCRIAAVGPSSLSGTDKTKLYYTLTPLTRSGTVLTPVDTKVLMRPILSRQEAEDFIAQRPAAAGGAGEPQYASAEEFYQQIVTSYDCRRMAGLIRSAVRRRKHALRTGRKVSQMDERYLRRAENALYGELAAALDLPEEEVLPYIRRTCPQWPE